MSRRLWLLPTYREALAPAPRGEPGPNTGPHRRITEGVKEKSGPGPALEEPSARSLPAGMCDGNSPPPRAPKGGKPRNTSVLPQAAVWELSTGEEGGVRAWPPGFWMARGQSPAATDFWESRSACRLQDSLFSTPSPAFIACRLLDCSYSDWREMVPHSGFDLHFSDNE